MAKTKRGYILASCFLSGAAAIISLVSLGTQEWVTADARASGLDGNDYIRFGLFGGIFHQESIYLYLFDLTMVCRFDLNVCALLCGDNMSDNLEKLYYGKNDTQLDNDKNCGRTIGSNSASSFVLPRAGDDDTSDRPFINSGVWLCTIIFLVISVGMGLFSAVLAVWNTAASPYQVYFSVFGLYIYNAIAFFAILLAIVLWGAMFNADLLEFIPSYKFFLEGFAVENGSQLGYSYWILLVSLFLYMASICLLYIRNYAISKEPEVNVHIEESADPVIYLY